MFPKHFHLFFLAELRKTFLRGSGKGTLVVSLLVALAVIGLAKLGNYVGGGVTMNGVPAENMFEFNGPRVIGWGLVARQAVVPLLLFWAAGASIAREYKEHTLRAILVRPVPRWSILLAKLLALLALSAASLLVTLAVSSIGGVALFGSEGEWGLPLLGYLTSWAVDLALLCMALLLALLLRNVAAVVVGLLLALLLERGTWAVLMAVGGVSGMWEHPLAEGIGRGIELLLPWMPGDGLMIWRVVAETWVWQSSASLALVAVISSALALLRFRRMDVP
jgi:hypothetical protein